MLRGVRFFGGGVRTHTLVMTAQRLLARFIDSTHIFDSQQVGRIRV